MDFDKLSQSINQQRKIKPISLKMYIQNLKKLYRMMGHTDEIKSLDFLKDYSKVLDALKDKQESTIKNYIASIVVVLTTDDKYKKTLIEYKKMMDDLADKDKENKKSQLKTVKQEKNWTTIKELQDILNDYKKLLTIKGVFKKGKDNINKKDKQLLQEYLIGFLYVGDLDNHPPLRLDYTPMKIISLNEYNKLDKDKKENYLVNASKNKKWFSFNQYKTEKTYGEKKIPLSSKLNTLINTWLKYNTSGWLLVNGKNEPLSSNGLTKSLNKVFRDTNKMISASMIRHIYLSEKFPAENKEKQDVADKMMHSTNEQNFYSKV